MEAEWGEKGAKKSRANWYTSSGFCISKACMKSARIAFKEGCSSMYCLCDSCSSSWNCEEFQKMQDPSLILRSHLKNVLEEEPRNGGTEHKSQSIDSRSPSYPGIWRPFLDLLPMEDNQEGTLWLSSDHPHPGMPSPQDSVSLQAQTHCDFSLFLRQLHDIAHACASRGGA